MLTGGMMMSLPPEGVGVAVVLVLAAENMKYAPTAMMSNMMMIATTAPAFDWLSIELIRYYYVSQHKELRLNLT